MHNFFRRLATAMMAMGLAATAVATSPSVTWIDAGDDFNTAGNWTGGSPSASTLLEFGTANPIAHQPTLSGPASALGLVFRSTAGAFTISGTGPLTLGGEHAITNDSSMAQTIAVPLIFTTGSSYHWIKNEGTLTLSGTISTSSGAWFKLAGSGANGTVSGAIGGTDDVVKYESGTWTLSGHNTFSGSLLVEQGTLNLTGTNTTANVQVFGGAILNANVAGALDAKSIVYVYGLGTLNVNSSQTIAALESGSSGSQAMVNIDPGAVLTLAVATGMAENFEGVIGGAGSRLVKAGAGAQTLSGVNTYSGTTTVSGGTLIINSDAALGAVPTAPVTGQLVLDGGTLQTTATFSLAANRGVNLASGHGTFSPDASTVLTVDGVIDGGGALIKTGAGTLVLTATNVFNAGTTISAGTLSLANANGTTLPTGSDVTLEGAGVLQVNRSQTLRGLISNSATSGVVVASGMALTVNLPSAGAEPTHTSATFAGVLSGDGGLVMGGPGTFTLTGANTYAGGTQLNGGFLVVSSDASLGAVTGDLSFNGGTLRASLASPFSSARSVLLNSGGGTIETAGFELTFSGMISGTGKLTHQGSGVLTLSGTNSYGGGTLVKGGGVLDFTSNANLGSGGVELDGGFLRTRVAIADFTHDLLLGSSGGNFNTAGFNSTVSGRLSGAGGLTVQSSTGNGVLTLTNAANQYAGATTISSGTVKVGVLNALPTDNQLTVSSGATLDVSFDQTLAGLSGAGAVSIAAGKTLTANLTFPRTFDGLLSGSGGLTKMGVGVMTLTGDSVNFSGPVSVTGGKLQLGSGGTSGSIAANVTLANGATLEVNRSDSSTVSFGNTIAGTGNFAKSGTATLALTNANGFVGFTGTATVSGGTLRAAADLTATGTTVSVSSGGTFAVGTTVTSGVTIGGLTGLGGTTIASGKKLTVAGTSPSTYGGGISGDGAFEKSGAGTLTLSGFSSYQGDTWLTAGVLTDGVSGAFSSNSTLRVNNGATLQLTFIQSVAGLQDYSTGVSGTVQLGSGASLTLNNAASNTFSGTLAGAGQLTKTALGESIFAGTSTYAGAAFINAGTLTVGATNAFTANSVSVNSAGWFNVAASTAIGSLAGQGTATVAAGKTLTLKNVSQLGTVISGAGAVTFENPGAGTSSITVDEAYTGLTTVNNGMLLIGVVGVNGGIGSVAGDLAVANSSAVVIFNRGADNPSYAGAISGSGSLRKYGLGTLTLSGTSTYTGSTEVTAGTLKLTAVNALPTTTGLTMGANTLLDLAASQTITRFLATDTLSSILIESGQVFDVTLGGQVTGTVFNGVISGAGQLEVGPSTDPQGGHALTLTGNNTYTGGTTIEVGGALRIGNGSTQHAAIVGNVSNNGFLIFQTSNDLNFSGTISGSGGLSLGLANNNSGGGDLRLSSASTYTGNTDIYHGGLFAMNASGSATGTGHVTVHGGLLAGTGTVAGSVDVLSGGTIAPAATLGLPGTLTVGDTLFAGGGKFAFQLDDADGTIGTNLSLLAIVGALNITATSANPFVVELYSIGPNQTQGLLANFNPAQAYSWQFLSASGGITGFSDKAFGVDPSQFQNALPSSGGFFVTQTGNNLFLEYSPTAVPEPSTWALLALGAGVLAVVGRRRRRPPPG